MNSHNSGVGSKAYFGMEIKMSHENNQGSFLLWFDVQAIDEVYDLNVEFLPFLYRDLV